jgi:hypothetical protein
MAKRSGERKAASSEGERKGRKGGRRRDKPSYRQQIRAKQLAGKKKAGCAPKLGTLLLPFAVVGAYFLLKA